MILSDRHEIAFIHIPKCAGSAVRTSLAPFDDANGAHNRVSQHPELGLIDYTHLTLPVLRDYFEADFDRICRYWSFAVLRDVRSRFLSGVAQHLRMYSDTTFEALNQTERVGIVGRLCDKLVASSGKLPPELIHFQPQIDYVILDGVRIVDRLYLTHQLESLFNDVQDRTGVPDLPSLPKFADNRTYTYRSDLLRVGVENLRPTLRPILDRIPHEIRKRWHGALFQAPDAAYDLMAEELDLGSFLRQHYSADIELVTSVRELEGGTSLPQRST